jgi:glycosyltransferase involved in cell wall biosynthesis
MPEAKLAVVILAHNEGVHIGRALDHVKAIAAEVFLIDSGSTDATVAIAEARGAVALSNPWTNYAQQFQWALDHAPITTDWVMRLDADEIIEPDLAAEIAARLQTLAPEVTGVNLKRKHIFMDRWIRHGGRYPLTLLRIWRRGAARIEQRWMDEHMLLTDGTAVTFEGGFSDHNLNDLTFFTDKHNKYATREAVDVLNQKYDLFPRDEAINAHSTSGAASGKRWLKEQIYNRLPFWAAPLGYFLYRYIIQLGFLDGREGLIYHGLQGGWYRFLVAAKIVELDRSLSPLPGRAERLEALSRLTGYRLGV